MPSFLRNSPIRPSNSTDPMASPLVCGNSWHRRSGGLLQDAPQSAARQAPTRHEFETSETIRAQIEMGRRGFCRKQLESPFSMAWR